MSCEVDSECGKNSSVKWFHLPIGLGTVGGGIYVVNAQCFANFLEELKHELLVIIRDPIYWWSEVKNPILDKVFRHLC